jgi:hypothetical protein
MCFQGKKIKKCWLLDAKRDKYLIVRCAVVYLHMHCGCQELFSATLELCRNALKQGRKINQFIRRKVPFGCFCKFPDTFMEYLNFSLTFVNLSDQKPLQKITSEIYCHLSTHVIVFSSGTYIALSVLLFTCTSCKDSLLLCLCYSIASWREKCCCAKPRRHSGNYPRKYNNLLPRYQSLIITPRVVQFIFSIQPDVFYLIESLWKINVNCLLILVAFCCRDEQETHSLVENKCDSKVVVGTNSSPLAFQTIPQLTSKNVETPPEEPLRRPRRGSALRQVRLDFFF